MPAVAEHDGEGERREEADEREVEAVQDDRLHVRVAVVARDRAEVLRRALLAHERLHHPHPGDVLGERRGHEPEPLPHRRVGAGRARAEERRRDDHERDHDQRREGEPRVEHEQQERRAAEQERALRERRDAVGDELVDRLDVVRHPADQHAGPVPLVEAEREIAAGGRRAACGGRRGSARRPSRSCTSRRTSCPSSPARATTKRTTTTTSFVPVVSLIASSSAYFARSGGASAVAVAARSEKTERKVRKRYGFVSRQRTPSRRRVVFHDQSSTSAPCAARSMPARLVDTHQATSSTSARASTASANCRSSRPWSWISR